MGYETIHTNYVLQRMAQAETNGLPINMIEIVVSDG